MSELDELLEREGVADVDGLMKWAQGRTEALLTEVSEDVELGQLLEAGGDAGPAPQPVTAEAPASTEPSGAAVEAPLESAEETLAPREPSKAAPLPPIPSVVRAQHEEDDAEEVDLDEIEELDMEELELVEEEEDEPAAPGAESNAEASPGAEGPPEAPTDDAPGASFGPPDGTDDVPEWKAALMSTQTESDAEAAEQVKEASSANPLPEAPVEPGMSGGTSGRLEAEDDEISQHSIDFSDLDTDDE